MDAQHQLFRLVFETKDTTTKMPYLVEPSITIKPNTTIEKGRASWRALHTQRRLTPEWLVEWEKTIPSECSCSSGYNSYKQSNPPQFKDELSDFEWGFNLHNFVNNKLLKPLLTLEEALSYWRPDLWNNCIAKKRDITIVTSFYEKNIERQLHCLNTWKNLGFEVVSVNLISEIQELRSIFPVQFEPAEPTFRYNRVLPKIHSLLTAPVQTDTRLLLNSDIEILHPIENFLSEPPSLGIRRNYIDTPMDGDIERWGIDAFLLPEELCSNFPNLDFAIGQPMFDYWIPWHLERLGVKPRWFADPLFFHKAHPTQWENSSLQTGWDIVYDHYNTGEDWELWRLLRPFHDEKQKEAILKYRYNQGIVNPTLATSQKNASN